MTTRFEWDSAKDAINRRKHGLSFEIARRVFADPLALSEPDRGENGEFRWRTIGTIDGFVIVIVAHTVTDEDEEGQVVEVIRIISARRAERKERRHYEQNR